MMTSIDGRRWIRLLLLPSSFTQSFIHSPFHRKLRPHTSKSMLMEPLKNYDCNGTLLHLAPRDHHQLLWSSTRARCRVTLVPKEIYPLSDTTQLATPYPCEPTLDIRIPTLYPTLPHNHELIYRIGNLCAPPKCRSKASLRNFLLPIYRGREGGRRQIHRSISQTSLFATASASLPSKKSCFPSPDGRYMDGVSGSVSPSALWQGIGGRDPRYSC